MVTVEEVKAGVARFEEETGQQVAAIRAVAESVEQAGAMLRALTTGTGHAQVAEALGRMAQVRQKLDEATQLALGAVAATRSYASGF